MERSNWTTLDLGNRMWGVTAALEMSKEISSNLPLSESTATAHRGATAGPGMSGKTSPNLPRFDSRATACPRMSWETSPNLPRFDS